MKISMLCFSRTGRETGMQLKTKFQAKGHTVLLDSKSKYISDSIEESHTEWTGRQFGHAGDAPADAVIFICSCGIAVRSIAPFVSNKKKDPAVLVIDECGKYVISLLSGHLGGANELAEAAAAMLGAMPIITTATDLHGRFAVDVFAKKNNCAIFPMNAAKEVSAALLAGENVGFYSDYAWDGEIPDGLILCREDGGVRKMQGETEEKAKEKGTDGYADGRPRIGIAVSIRRACSPFPVTLHLIPRTAVLGIGCRKGKEAAEIRKAVQKCLYEAGIYQDALYQIGSIDLKKEEEGILELAESLGISFQTFAAETLQTVKGQFSDSDFVKSVTGVDNVCERSAVLASGNGTIIKKKTGDRGVTTALAVRDWRIRFE